MPRKRVTQIFPWLLPLRRKQRLFFFYTGMRLDGNRYAAGKSDLPLPYPLFETRCPLYNRETGFDMVYQENKVFNLANGINHIPFARFMRQDNDRCTIRSFLLLHHGVDGDGLVCQDSG